MAATTNHYLQAYLATVQSELCQSISQIDDAMYNSAVAMILTAEQSKNRVHVTGIGKPSHVARYIASLFSSTGTKAYFLDGTEAVHGSCGQLEPGDVVICISNSGQTEELKATVTGIKGNGCKVIAVTGNKDSWLSHHADVTLFAHVREEGGPLNRAPRTSVLAEILVLQGLSVILQGIKNITPDDYVKWHPGGVLGKLRENER